MDALSAGKKSESLSVIAISGLVLSAAATAFQWGTGGTIFGGMVFFDGLTSVFKILLCIIGILTLLYSPEYLRFRGIRLGEYYSLLLMCIIGMMVMVAAANLLMFFLGLETMSIALYVLVGFERKDEKSTEASMKYLVLGAFASGFLLFGMALVYGAVGSADYVRIAAYFSSAAVLGPMVVAGIALMLVGFAFKIAAVPFHFWSPDVYDGAPAVVTGFMSTGPKAAAFIGLIRLFGVTMAPASGLWNDVLTWLAILTMTVGNVVALRQTSVKRMLAYSSVAHAGYLLVGIVAGTHAAFAAASYYLIAYAIMNLGAFAVLMLINTRSDRGYQFEDFRGMGFSRPLLGISLTIFLLSLTGVPPTAGFFGKFYVFSAAIEQGYIVLAVVGMLNSAVAAYYYLRVITLLYMGKAEGSTEVPQPQSYRFALVISSLVIIVVGLFPEQLLRLLLVAVP